MQGVHVWIVDRKKKVSRPTSARDLCRVINRTAEIAVRAHDRFRSRFVCSTIVTNGGACSLSVAMMLLDY